MFFWFVAEFSEELFVGQKWQIEQMTENRKKNPEEKQWCYQHMQVHLSVSIEYIRKLIKYIDEAKVVISNK